MYQPKGKETSEGLIPPNCNSSIYSYEETIFKQFVKKMTKIQKEH